MVSVALAIGNWVPRLVYGISTTFGYALRFLDISHILLNLRIQVLLRWLLAIILNEITNLVEEIFDLHNAIASYVVLLAAQRLHFNPWLQQVDIDFSLKCLLFLFSLLFQTELELAFLGRLSEGLHEVLQFNQVFGQSLHQEESILLLIANCCYTLEGKHLQHVVICGEAAFLNLLARLVVFLLDEFLAKEERLIIVARGSLIGLGHIKHLLSVLIRYLICYNVLQILQHSKFVVNVWENRSFPIISYFFRYAKCVFALVGRRIGLPSLLKGWKHAR